MQLWIDKEQCSACGACANICPKGAIELVNDQSGYAYPTINPDLCIDCGLCESRCAVKKSMNQEALSVEPKSEEPAVYAAWSKSFETRYLSTSGGVFSELAQVILAEGGYICGAVYDENHLVYHEVVNTLDGLKRIRQSKYIQSEIRFCFKEIKERLQEGKKVLFCGAPCQVAGLYEFLGQDHENLFTVDFICRGMNSPLAYRAWLDDLEEEFGAKATKVWFKNKARGWNKFSTRVEFANGKVYTKSRYEDMFMRAYLQHNLFIRPSCTDCQFKGVPRLGDLTVADFWGINKKYDADLGTSMVVVNSEKGQTLFEASSSELVTVERSYEEALKGNVCLKNSVKTGEHSKEFFAKLQEGKSFTQAFRESVGETEPLVSVIVTISDKNSRPKTCLESICKQKYERIEVLLTCASADDAIAARLEELAAIDSRIRILPRTTDAVTAKNQALQEAKGEYLHFCNGFEDLYENFYKSAIESMWKNKASVLCCGYLDENRESMSKYAFSGNGNAKAFLELMMTSEANDSDYSGYGLGLSNKVFKTDVFRLEDADLFFDDYAYGLHDVMWMIKIACNISQVHFVSVDMLRVHGKSKRAGLTPTFACDEFFDLQEQMCNYLMDVQPFAYDTLKRICYDYELELLIAARTRKFKVLSAKLQDHMAICLENQKTMEELISICCDNYTMQKESNLLISKNKTLLKSNESLGAECTSLKSKVSSLDSEVKALKQVVAVYKAKEEKRIGFKLRRLARKIKRKIVRLIKK